MAIAVNRENQRLGLAVMPPGAQRADFSDLESFLQLEPAKEPALSLAELSEPIEVDGRHEMYADLLLRCASASTNLLSAVDLEESKLPSVSQQIILKSQLEDMDNGLGLLAREAQISWVTGCWGLPDAYRDQKGYPMTWDARKYGLEPRSKGEYKGMRLYQVSYILRMSIEMPEHELPPGAHLEHNCRQVETLGCLNPFHVREISGATENNRLQRLAHAVEDVLHARQLILGSIGHSGIDRVAAQSPFEDTGASVSTRFGTIPVVKVDEDPLVIRGGERIQDPLADNIRPPAKKEKQVAAEDLTAILRGELPLPKPKRKSRAKQVEVLPGQKVLF